MSSTNWKAELRRRIEDIKSKKQAAEKQAAVHTTLSRSRVAASVALKTQEDIQNTPSQLAGGAGFAAPAKGQTASAVLAEIDANAGARTVRAPVGPRRQPAIDSQQSDQKNQTDLKANEFDPAEGSEHSSDKSSATQVKVRAKSPTTTRGEEPTLFPVQNKLDNDRNLPDDSMSSVSSRSRKQTTETTAAPKTSGFDDELDSYVSLDQHGREGEIEPGVPETGKPKPDTAKTTTRNSKRFYAASIDSLLILGVESLLVLVAGFLLDTSPFQMVMLSPLSFISLFLVLHFIYYVPFTSISGQTLGKKIMGVVLVPRQPGIIGLPKAAARWLLQLVTLLPAAVGYFWMYLDREGRTMADLLLGMKLKEIRK